MPKSGIAKLLKQIAVVAIVGGTLVLFYVYSRRNPEALNSLRDLNLMTLVLLGLGYALTVLVNASVLFYSLLYIQRHVPLFENFLVTSYSSIVNFFGPLQSGPGFRAIYFKKRHSVRVRDFLGVTAIFYVFFALINALIVCIATAYRYGSPLLYLAGLAALIVGALLLFHGYKRIKILRTLVAVMRLKDRNFWMIGVWTLGLVAVMCGIYFIELQVVDSDITLWRAVTYTAVANLALFVSLTPGAIGFREAFLLFTQQLHSVDTSIIVAANVIDRAFYIIFLFLLFIIVLAINARKHLPLIRLKPGK